MGKTNVIDLMRGNVPQLKTAFTDKYFCRLLNTSIFEFAVSVVAVRAPATCMPILCKHAELSITMSKRRSNRRQNQPMDGSELWGLTNQRPSCRKGGRSCKCPTFWILVGFLCSVGFQSMPFFSECLQARKDCLQGLKGSLHVLTVWNYRKHKFWFVCSAEQWHYEEYVSFVQWRTGLERF